MQSCCSRRSFHFIHITAEHSARLGPVYVAGDLSIRPDPTDDYSIPPTGRDDCHGLILHTSTSTDRLGAIFTTPASYLYDETVLELTNVCTMPITTILNALTPPTLTRVRRIQLQRRCFNMKLHWRYHSFSQQILILGERKRRFFCPVALRPGFPEPNPSQVTLIQRRIRGSI